ncbi:MAG TPA: NADH-quinone oxidoreductase subunit J [Gemmatimonadales bacterium]|nr:NADH-quinone oxidoreductase subunit J [Gemmatimonadales bacterium]
MNWDAFLFGSSAALALIGALFAVSLKNIFHNILGFALALVGVAGLFLTLGSDFLAIVLLLVYVGALGIAMVYAVMLSQPLDTPRTPRSLPKIAGSALLAALVAMALWLVIRRAHFPGPPEVLEVAPQWIGRRLLQDYVLAFELISVLLVVAMIGAVMVARRDPGRRAPGTAAGTAPRPGAPR